MRGADGQVHRRQLRPEAEITGSFESVAGLLRDNGVPVLEGMRTRLVAMRHMLGQTERRRTPKLARPKADPARRASASELLAPVGTGHVLVSTPHGTTAVDALMLGKTIVDNTEASG